MNHVFISYRHESVEHALAVRRLGDLLKQAGIPVELDQFFLEQYPGGPDEGWPKWCEDRASKSACVLIIASSGWFDAYNKTAEPGVGLGAASEADLFRQSFWDEQGNNARIRVTHLSEIAVNTIPGRLRAWHQFHPFTTNSELDQLVSWIAGHLKLLDTKPLTLQWPNPLLDFQPDIANRCHAEWPAIRGMLAGQSRHRILLLEAESGYGKSELLRQALDYAEIIGIQTGRLNFKSNYERVTDILGRLAVDLGEQLPNFSRDGANKTHLLIKDFRALREPVFLVIDTYEEAIGEFREWICQNLLAEVERSPGLSVIVAGRPKLPAVYDTRWRSVAQYLPLEPIHDTAHWEAWTHRRYPVFHDLNIDLHTLVLASGGIPRIFADLCRTIALQAQLAKL